MPKPIDKPADLFTSDDNHDVLIYAQEGASVRNKSNITTTGTNSSALSIEANGVSLVNSGNLVTSGDGSLGIVAGGILEPHFDHVSVANYGSIATSGGFYDANGNGEIDPGDRPADAIDVFGNFASVANYGKLVTGSPDTAGIGIVGSHSTVTNYGAIEAVGIGIVSDVVDGTEAGNFLINRGSIHTAGGEFAHAIWVFSSDTVVQNYGTIAVDGFHDFGITLDEAPGNLAENRGTILVNGEQARGIAMAGGVEAVNYGKILVSGIDGIGVRFGEPTAGGDTFVNYGEVRSVAWAVRGASLNDTVVNHGLLSGLVDLGRGDDTYVAGRGGSLDQALVLGTGDDTVVVERGAGQVRVADFVAGAGSEDRFDFSAFGLKSFGDVLAHAKQAGGDVTIALVGANVVIEHTALGALSADDFILAGASGAAMDHALMAHAAAMPIA